MFISSLAWVLGGALFAFVYRIVHKKIAKPGALTLGAKNIGKKDRIARVIIGLVLLVLAYNANMDPGALFFAGFAFFEAAFSWCGLYALMGRNTCPVE